MGKTDTHKLFSDIAHKYDWLPNQYILTFDTVYFLFAISMWTSYHNDKVRTNHNDNQGKENQSAFKP